MGLSALFAMVGSYEFAYFAAPRSIQSLFMSLLFSAAGIAAFINIVFSKYFLKPANEDPNSNVSFIESKPVLSFILYFIDIFSV